MCVCGGGISSTRFRSSCLSLGLGFYKNVHCHQKSVYPSLFLTPGSPETFSSGLHLLLGHLEDY